MATMLLLLLILLTPVVQSMNASGDPPLCPDGAWIEEEKLKKKFSLNEKAIKTYRKLYHNETAGHVRKGNKVGPFSGARFFFMKVKDSSPVVAKNNTVSLPEYLDACQSIEQILIGDDSDISPDVIEFLKAYGSVDLPETGLTSLHLMIFRNLRRPSGVNWPVRPP